MEKKIKNIEPQFYQNWSREQLVEELCRLNQLLLDCIELAKKYETSNR